MSTWGADRWLVCTIEPDLSPGGVLCEQSKRTRCPPSGPEARPRHPLIGERLSHLAAGIAHPSLGRPHTLITHAKGNDTSGCDAQNFRRERLHDRLPPFWQPFNAATNFHHARLPGRQHIIDDESHAPIAHSVPVFLRRHNSMPADSEWFSFKNKHVTAGRPYGNEQKRSVWKTDDIYTLQSFRYSDHIC